MLHHCSIAVHHYWSWLDHLWFMTVKIYVYWWWIYVNLVFCKCHMNEPPSPWPHQSWAGPHHRLVSSSSVWIMGLAMDVFIKPIPTCQVMGLICWRYSIWICSHPREFELHAKVQLNPGSSPVLSGTAGTRHDISGSLWVSRIARQEQMTFSSAPIILSVGIIH